MRHILVSTAHALRDGSALMHTTSFLAMGVALGIFTMAEAWMRLPMIGTAALVVAYRRTL